MREAWIYGDGSPGLEAANMLAELGFSPRRIGSRTVQAGPQAAYPELVLILVAGTLACAPVNALLRDLRADPELCDVPLVVAIDSTAAASDEDQIAASIQCDEVILQPIRIEELGVRIARARSRHGIVSAELIRLGSLEIDLAAYEVRLHGAPLELTHMEYRLLELLATHPKRVHSRERLLSRMWGHDHAAGARTVDGHVGRLRAKLGPEHEHRIRTVRNVGYRFEP
jgi:DNA-binding response OmpR family regulator